MTIEQYGTIYRALLEAQLWFAARSECGTTEYERSRCREMRESVLRAEKALDDGYALAQRVAHEKAAA